MKVAQLIGRKLNLVTKSVHRKLLHIILVAAGIFLGLFLVFLLISWPIWRAYSPGGVPFLQTRHGFTQDTKLIEIELRGLSSTKLRIPKAYLYRKDTWDGGQHASLPLQIAYPSLMPWSFVQMSEDDSENDQSRKKLRLTPYSKNIERDLDFFYARYGFSRTTQSSHGLVVFRPDPLKTPPLKEIFSTNQDDPDGWLLIVCPKFSGDAKKGICTVSSEYGGSIHLRYIIHKAMLSEWRFVHHRIRKLLDLFVVERSQTERE